MLVDGGFRPPGVPNPPSTPRGQAPSRQLVDNGDGWWRLKNRNSGKVIGVDGMSTADSAQVVQFADSGTADHVWRLVPDGRVRVENRNSGKVLGVDQLSTADSAQVVQFGDTGTADHLWRLR